MREVFVEMDPSKLKCEYLNGAYNDIANLLGIDAVLKLHAAYRGQQITFFQSSFSQKNLLQCKSSMSMTATMSSS